MSEDAAPYRPVHLIVTEGVEGRITASGTLDERGFHPEPLPAPVEVPPRDAPDGLETWVR